MAQVSVRSLKGGIKKIQGQIVAILVGPSKEPFHVHESTICTSSLFFKKAMSGPWKESEEHTLELPEDDPQIFALYSHWLYVAKIPVIAEAIQGATREEPEKNSAQEYSDLFKAYVLGDKLLDAKFQNSVIDAIVEKCSTPDAQDGRCYYPYGDVINYAYQNTTESAKIRNLLVDIYVDSALTGWLTRELPQEFLYSVVKGLIKKRSPHTKHIRAPEYYVHPSGN